MSLRQFLQEQYDFGCTCSCCSLPASESRGSDARLVKLSELYRELARWGKGQIGARRAADIAREIWTVGDEEGYVSERGRLAADIAHVAAAVQECVYLLRPEMLLFSSRSSEDAVREWAQLGERWASYELGNDSALARELRSYMHSPQTHPVWGFHGRQERVGGLDEHPR